MKKDLYMKNPNENVVIQSDDLKYDGKNIIIPSYYAGVIHDYLAHVDHKNLPEPDRVDYLAFLKFIEDILDHKEAKYNK